MLTWNQVYHHEMMYQMLDHVAMKCAQLRFGFNDFIAVPAKLSLCCGRIRLHYNIKCYMSILCDVSVIF
jgi:hypothetical protein